MINKRTVLAGLAVIAASAPAYANVTISTAATQNMNCSGGTCVPTATNAVLNASDLENDLTQFGNVRVMTTGTGVEANNIVVNAAFSSPDSTSLTLDAHKAITINTAVSIGSGTAELELQSGKGGELGTLAFGPKGHITFASLSDVFGINGGIFTLVGSVQGLASAVAANPNGSYALAASYNAKGDGTYKSSPVSEPFGGSFEGLGNQISSLRINDTASNHFVALFSELKSRGSVRDMTLVKPRVAGGAATRQGEESIGPLVGYSSRGIVERSIVLGGKVSGGAEAIVGGLVGTNAGGSVQQSVANLPTSGAIGAVVGGLIGQNQARNGKDGTVSYSHASGDVTVAGESAAGGLVGANFGIISACFAGGSVTATGGYWIGGLAGESDNLITQSFATGSASGGLYVGGLAGFTNGQVEDSYATGAVASATYIGGLTGENDGIISVTYSTGQVSEAGATDAGGLEGIDESEGTSNSYWDTDMSGITNLSQGAGSPSNDPGITGLTTAQFQSGLPSGFDPKVWAENPNINNGLPYLIANPPPK